MDRKEERHDFLNSLFKSQVLKIKSQKMELIDKEAHLQYIFKKEMEKLEEELNLKPNNNYDNNKIT